MVSVPVVSVSVTVTVEVSGLVVSTVGIRGLVVERVVVLGRVSVVVSPEVSPTRLSDVDDRPHSC